MAESRVYVKMVIIGTFREETGMFSPVPGFYLTAI